MAKNMRRMIGTEAEVNLVCKAIVCMALASMLAVAATGGANVVAPFTVAAV